jgi:hypothetical protein
MSFSFQVSRHFRQAEIPSILRNEIPACAGMTVVVR